MDHVSRGEALPAAAYEPWLRRAYSHYAGENLLPDPVMIQVEQLTLPASEFTRHVLNALLICRDSTNGQIAAWLGLAEPVIIAYETLFWNVKKKSAEQTARLVFPRGRFESLRTDGVEEMTIEARLLVAGCTHGAQEVLWLAGVGGDQNPPSVEEGIKAFEKNLVTNALQLARAGALNSKSAPGIAHGKSLLAARRDGEAGENPARVSLPDVSLDRAIYLSMGRKTDEESAHEKKDAHASLKQHLEFLCEQMGK
jgi:hypothetical protein